MDLAQPKKVGIGSYPLVFPIPVVLVGANVDGAPNYEAIGNCSIAGFNPGLVFVSSVRSHYTNRGIIANGSFSVNMPTESMVAAVDFCGIESGRDFLKGNLFTSFYGQLGTAPMIGECPVALECRVIHTFSHNDMDMFVGEVVEAYVDEPLARWVADPRHGAAPGTGRWRFRRTGLGELQPLIFHHDNLYYGIGGVVGRGYHDGKTVEAPRRQDPSSDRQ